MFPGAPKPRTTGRGGVKQQKRAGPSLEAEVERRGVSRARSFRSLEAQSGRALPRPRRGRQALEVLGCLTLDLGPP